jgi:hypothetical protein
LHHKHDLGTLSELAPHRRQPHRNFETIFHNYNFDEKEREKERERERESVKTNLKRVAGKTTELNSWWELKREREMYKKRERTESGHYD